MTTLNVHLHEYDSENKEGREKLAELASRGPIAISLAPIHLRERRFNRDFLYFIEEIVTREGNLLGQRGDTNFCVRRNHSRLDKFHENRCPYTLFGNSIDVQLPFMERGSEDLARVFLKEPEIYTPPNHLYDGNTVEAARQLGFSYFSTYDVFGVKPSLDSGMVFVPERSCHLPGLLDRLSVPSAIHTHLGHLTEHWEIFDKLELTSFDQLPIGRSFFVKRMANSFVKYALKYFRDVRKLVKKGA